MTNPLHVLLVEDSEDDALLLVRELRRGERTLVYERVDSGTAFVDALSREHWDLILCDFTMPHFRGTEALEILKHQNLDIPFIFVSGTIGEHIAVEAMKAGAQDYVMKGNLRRLLPAVERELREAEIRRQKREAEAEVRESEERLRFIIDSDDNGLVVVDQNGIALFVNRSAAALFGSEASMLTGIKLGFPLTNASEAPSEMLIPRGDQMLTVEITARRIEWDKQPAFLVSLHDVSPRKEAENAVREYDRWLKESQRVGQVGSYELDIAKGQWTSSEVLDGILGIGKEFDRTLNGWLGIVHPEDREMIRSYFLEEILGKHKPFDKDYRIVAQTCHEGRWVHGRGELSLNAAGNPVKMVGTIHDITERKKAERELRDSEERFRTLFESAPDAYYLMDTEGVFLDGNAGTEKITGYRREELRGKNFITSGVLATQDIERAVHAFNEVLHGQPVSQDEFCIRQRNGNIITVELRTELINIAGRNVILGIVRDISERKLAEKSLRESEQRFRRIFENAKDVIYMIDLQGSLFRLSPAFREITGWKPEDWLGKSFLEIVHPDDQQRAMEIFNDVVKKNKSSNFEMRIARKGGEYWEGEFSGGPISEGGEVMVLGIARDVTTRKHAEQQIRDQAQLIDVASDAIFLRDMNDRILSWSKGAERIYGWTRDEVIGKTGREVFYGGQPQVFDDIKRQLETTGLWEGELTHAAKDGKRLIVQSRLTLMKDPAGKPTSILSVNTDVTERKALESQFLRAQRLESLGTLAGGIAHDLNNVLGPIMLTFDSLKRNLTDERMRKMVTSAETSALRGKNIVSQILTFARGSEGKLGPIQLRHVLREVIDMAIETFPKNIGIKQEIDRGLWTVNADTTAIHQLTMNLLVNARDAMPDGGILKVETRNFEIDQQFARLHLHAKVGPYVRLTISDTGTGMSKEVLDHIFDPFFTTKQPGKGTGLGLATVHTIVNKHGGFIDVSSKVGQGSTFHIYFPATAGQKEAAAAEIKESPRMGHNEVILVVDDEAAVIDIMRQTLEEHGYRVMTAGNGVEGVAVYSQHKDVIAAVVTDIMMPIMDGVAMARALRQIDAGVPIVATSGIMPESFSTVAKEVKFALLLDKPFNVRDLLEAVNSVLKKKGS